MCVNGRHGGNTEFFVGDVCVRGGRWFFEAKLAGPPDYVCFGWVTRDFRSGPGYVTLGGDQPGCSWAVVGPGTQYMHRSVNRIPSTGKGKATQPVRFLLECFVVLSVVFAVVVRVFVC